MRVNARIDQPGASMLKPVSTGIPRELTTMLYFSLITLTTTGYGDIPVDPLARSLATLEFGRQAILCRYHSDPPRDAGTG